jgi:RNA polymerase sigma-70 factor (ECF subfamily)
MESEFSNTDIAASLNADNPQQFRAVVEHFQHAVFGFLGRMGFTQADAEDIAQEVFLKVWRYRASYNPAKAQVSTWLFTIARNTAITKLQQTGNAHVCIEDIEVSANSDSQPEQQLLQHQQQQTLLRAIHRLPVDDRSAIALFYINDLTTAQAADVLECSVGTFKTRLSRARNKLKVIFDELDKSQ